MTKFTYRKTQQFLLLISFFVFFASLYFQYIRGMQACPLCLMQRFCVFLLLIIVSIRYSTLRKAQLMPLLQVLVAGAGLFFATRQLWIQSMPAGKVPVCMPGLDVLIKYFPWQTVAKVLFWGSGECVESSWNWLGISMPGWSALYFLFMIIAGIFLFYLTRAGSRT